MTQFFAIVCMGRTGSTMLVSMLDSHPDIECRGELFQPNGAFRASGLTRSEFLDRAAYTTDRPVKGFKMPYDWIVGQPGIFDDFKERGYKIIRLDRRNLIAHHVSAELAVANQDWSSSREYRQQTLSLSPWKVLTFVGFRFAATAALNAMCAGLDCLQVDYEALADAGTQARILSFLGVRPHPLTVSTVRARTRPVHEVVANYDELVRFFADGPHSAWFPPRHGAAAARAAS